MKTLTISDRTLYDRGRANTLAAIRRESQAMADELQAPVRWVRENGNHVTTFNPTPNVETLAKMAAYKAANS